MEVEECIICDKESKEISVRSQFFRLRTNEREKLICYSKVRVDKNDSKFSKFRQIQAPESCYKTYVSRELAICTREKFENGCTEAIESISEVEGFQYTKQCIFYSLDASDEFIEKGRKKVKTKHNVTILSERQNTKTKRIS